MTGTTITPSTVPVTATGGAVTSESLPASTIVWFQTSSLTDSSHATETSVAVVERSSLTASVPPSIKTFGVAPTEITVTAHTSTVSVAHASQTSTLAQVTPSSKIATGNVVLAEPLDLITQTLIDASSRIAVTVPIQTSPQESVTQVTVEPTRSTVDAGQTIPDGTRIVSTDTEITIEPGDDREELVVEGTNPGLTKVTVNELTKDPKLNLKSLLKDGIDGTQTVTYPVDLSMIVISSGTEVEVKMPPSVMTGTPRWDGVLDLPRLVPTSSIDLRSGTVTSAVQMGLDEDPLTFDNPVRIVFYGKAGQTVGFERGDDRQRIETACVADNGNEVRIQLGGEGACQIDIGADLAVWTFHFTVFYTFVAPQMPTEPTIPEPTPVVIAPVSPAPSVSEPASPAPSETAPSQMPSPGAFPSQTESIIVRGGGGGGGGGGSVSGAASGTPAGVPAHVRQVSWDCGAGLVTVLAGPNIEELSVSVRTSKLGQNPAERQGVSDGYAQFVAPMDSDDRYLIVQAVYLAGRGASTDSKSLDLASCEGSETFEVPAPPQTVQVGSLDSAPAAAPEPDMDGAAGASESAELTPVTAGIEPPVKMPEPADTEPPAPDPVAEPGAPEPARISQEPGGGCLVATAAYGSELAPQVQVLREVRDGVLMQTEAGTALVHAFNAAYYAVSPGIADAQRQNPALNQAARVALAPALWSASYLGLDADTAGYGLAAAMLATGAWVLVPRVASRAQSRAQSGWIATVRNR